MTLSRSSEVCPSCGGPVSERPAHPYPVLIQVLFGLSFVAFLVFAEKIKTVPGAVWGWCAIQVALGALLIRGRVRTRKRILRCIRCGMDLR